MPLINCPECGKEVSDHARDCPNCGYSISGMNKRKADAVGRKRTTWGIVAFAILFILFQLWNYIKNDEENSSSTEGSYSNDLTKKKIAPTAQGPEKSEQDRFLDSEFMTQKDRDIFNELMADDAEVYNGGGDSLIGRVIENKYTKINGSNLYKVYKENEISADYKFRNKEIILSGYVLSIDRNLANHGVLKIKGSDTFINVVYADFGDTEKAYSSLSDVKKGSVQNMICKVDGLAITSVRLSNCRLAKYEINNAIKEIKNIKISNRDIIDALKDKGSSSGIFINPDYYTIKLAVVLQSFSKSISINYKECLDNKKISECLNRENISSRLPKDIEKYFEAHGVDTDNLNFEQLINAI